MYQRVKHLQHLRAIHEAVEDTGVRDTRPPALGALLGKCLPGHTPGEHNEDPDDSRGSSRPGMASRDGQVTRVQSCAQRTPAGWPRRRRLMRWGMTKLGFWRWMPILLVASCTHACAPAAEEEATGKNREALIAQERELYERRRAEFARNHDELLAQKRRLEELSGRALRGRDTAYSFATPADAVMEPTPHLTSGDWSLQEVDEPAFPPNVVPAVARELPPEMLGRWTRAGWHLLITPHVFSETQGLIGSFGGHYEVLGRSGARYAFRFRNKAAQRTLELVDGHLEMSVRYNAFTTKRLAELLPPDVFREGRHFTRWSRPGPAETWVDRAEDALVRVLPELIERADTTLRLAYWPYHATHVIDGYTLRRGDGLELVFMYQAGPQVRLWVSPLSAQGAKATGDFLTIDGAILPEDPFRAYGVSVPWALAEWAARWVVPLLPRP